jgi:hypothetical protein
MLFKKYTKTWNLIIDNLLKQTDTQTNQYRIVPANNMICLVMVFAKSVKQT